MRSAWNCVSETGVDDDELIKICYQSRGRIRLIINSSVDEVKSAFFSDSTRRRVMQAIFCSYLKANSYVDIGHVVSLIAEDFNWKTVYSYEMILSEVDDLTAGLLYQMADEGIIHFSGSYDIGFSHPSDILTMAKLFAGNHPSGILSDLAKLSMLSPNQSGMADINEGLVAESLAHSGFDVVGFGKLKFTNDYNSHFNTGIERQGDGTRRYSEQGFTNDETEGFGSISRNSWISRISRSVQRSRPARLRKEVPDEGGSDLVSVFEVGGKDPVKWLVFRVQVKMGISRDTYTKPRVVEFMKFHEQAFIKKLGVTEEEVHFVRVLWTAQKTSIVHQPEENVYVVDSLKMMKYWSPRIQKFVVEEKLGSYGYM